MLTGATTTVDAPPRSVMWPISRVAQRDGISKQAVSNHVKRLVERSNLTVERDGQGRVAAVNVVEYDHFRSLTGDPSKAQAPASLAAPVPGPRPVVDAESYNEALRQKTWHEATKRGLELKELRGELVRRDVVTRSAIRIGQEAARIFDRLPASSDELATAVARDGTHGLRVALKQLAASLRTDLADVLASIAADAPETDPVVDEPASVTS